MENIQFSLYKYIQCQTVKIMTELSKNIHVFNKSAKVPIVAINNLMENLDKPVVEKTRKDG